MRIYTTVFGELGGRISHEPAMRAIFDTDGRVAADGHLGIWDLDRRLPMDVEIFTSEFVYPATTAPPPIFFNTFNRGSPAARGLRRGGCGPTTGGCTTLGSYGGGPRPSVPRRRGAAAGFDLDATLSPS